MGSSTHAGVLAAKIHSLAVALPAAGTAGLVKAAKVVEASVGVASGRYRGHAITEVKTTVAPAPVSTALVRMTSRKAHLLDHDTHFPQAARSRDITSSSEFVPRSGVRTQGKYMWERGVIAARPGIVAAMGNAIGEGMRKVFSR